MINFVRFPDLSNASEDGVLAMGGDLSVDTLVSAYSQGIFPWFNEGQPILWWSPDPRLVIFPNQMHVSKSLAKTIRQQKFTLRCNSAFEAVLRGCAWRGQVEQAWVQPATWITDDMHRAYMNLHQAGYAHSIEAWQGEQLVGGLYGVVLGKVFFGESMFSSASNASKVAFHGLCQWLIENKFSVIDCQIENDHLLSLGAVDIARTKFCEYLQGINVNETPASFGEGFAQFALEQIPVISTS